MSIHEPTPMFEAYNPAVLFELDYGQLLKEQADFENQRSADPIPRTVAHYASAESNDYSFSSECVATYMIKFGMDVIPIHGEYPGDPLIGLIFEHQADVESEEFKEHVEQIKLCLHQLGWNYDGYVGEDVVPCSDVLSIN